MNAITPPPAADSLYVYAVLPGEGGSVPEAAAILTGSQIGSLEEGGLAALVSRVPRCLFQADHPMSRAADPGWVAECAEAHHRVVALATKAGPCLPLGFGTLFSSEASLRLWLGSEAAALRKTLEAVADRQEWGLTLVEDPPAHEAWLEEHEPELKALAVVARAASPGTGYLLERRLARAREQARLRHQEDAAARLAARLVQEGVAIRREPSQTGFAWSLLAGRDDGLCERLESLSAEILGGSGLVLRISGPWPPYGFARAAWQENGDA